MYHIHLPVFSYDPMVRLQGIEHSQKSLVNFLKFRAPNLFNIINVCKCTEDLSYLIDQTNKYVNVMYYVMKIEQRLSNH